MELFVENIVTIDSLRRDRPSVYHGFEASGHDGSGSSFRDELLRRMDQIGIERALLELQAQFAPVISADRMSQIMASNVVNRLRVKG